MALTAVAIFLSEGDLHSSERLDAVVLLPVFAFLDAENDVRMHFLVER
jgi:hypothetical protein